MKRQKRIYDIVDNCTLRVIKSVETSSNNIVVTTPTSILIYTLTIIVLCVSLFGFKMYNDHKEKQQILNEVFNIENDKMNNEYVNNLCWQIGKYKLLGKQDIPTDSLNVCYEFIKEMNAWYPQIVYAQLILESASGQSQLAQNANNLFGMKVVEQRPTTQLKDTDYNNYGKYANWQHSIIDRLLWDNFVFRGSKPTYNEYINVLRARYAEDTNYIDKLMTIIKQIENID